MNILNNEVKREIFELFLKNSKLKFSEIEKHTKIRSNLLTFYIKKLQEEKVIEKTGEHYKLTLEAEKIIPFYKQTFEGNGKLPVVLIAIQDKKDKENLLLLKREERPYKSYYSLLGKKMRLSETIEETAIRCAKEETNLEVKFKKLCGVVHERLKEDNEFKHSFVFFICLVEADMKDQQATSSKDLRWFGIKKIDRSNGTADKIIPSDIWMIKNILPKKQKVSEIIMEEKQGELYF